MPRKRGTATPKTKSKRATQASVASRPRVCESVLDAIGETPLIRLRKYVRGGANWFVKFEAMNPAGSSKDRPAREMIDAVERSGTLKPGGRVIISTSGNMGIAMAMICATKGYRLTCIVDPKISRVNESILRVYGAVLEKVTKLDRHGGYHLTRLARVDALCAEDRSAVYIDQYDNEFNVRAHYMGTGPEIAAALQGKVDAVVVPAGTGGTLMGIARYFKDHHSATRIWAVDEHGSLALPNNSVPKTRYLNGMGTGIRPANYDYPNLSKYVDHQCHVSAAEAIRGAIALAREEGILTGGSGGAVAHVMKHVISKSSRRGQNVVGILPDHGSRYIDTFFDKNWLAARELEVSDL